MVDRFILYAVDRLQEHWQQVDFMQEFRGRVAGVKVKPVDTTGAGDAFVSGILNSLASDLNLIQVPVVIEETKEMFWLHPFSFPYL